MLATTGLHTGTALARMDARQVVAAARGELSHLGDRAPDSYRSWPGMDGTFSDLLPYLPAAAPDAAILA